jgi:hypothetical protein
MNYIGTETRRNTEPSSLWAGGGSESFSVPLCLCGIPDFPREPGHAPTVDGAAPTR